MDDTTSRVAGRSRGTDCFKDTGRVLAGTRNTVVWAALGHAKMNNTNVMRHRADVEAIHTDEGTETIRTLIVRKHVTGVGAFT
jgi:hypothetical protein